MCLRAISQASMGFQAVGGMAEEAAGLVQALEQGLPVDPHSQQAFASAMRTLPIWCRVRGIGTVDAALPVRIRNTRSSRPARLG